MKKLLSYFRQALSGKEMDFTTGSLNKAIFLLSVPMVLEMLMEGLFSIVDAYYVGLVSNEAAATIGLTETVLTFVYSLAIGISIAATAMVSRRIGEKQPNRASFAAVQAIILGVIASVIIGIPGVLFAENILELMGAEPEVIETGLTYTQIIFGTNIVIMMLFILNGIFRGAGDALMAMYSLWVANILNIILDPLLIFGIGPFPELGVTGAAVATSIGRGLGVVFQLYILFNGKKIIQIARRHLHIIPTMLRKLVDVSATGAFQFLIASASWIFIARIVAQFGTDVFAGYFFAIRIVIFTILPSWGMANAAATLVGQNLGAGKPERAEKSVWRTAFFNMIFLGFLSIIFLIWAEHFIAIFTSHPVSLKVGTMGLRVICAGYIFFAYGMVLGQAFGGAGDTRTPTLVNFIGFWLVEIPLAWILSELFNTGPGGVYWAIFFSEILVAILFVTLFRRGKWKLVKI